MAARGGMGLSHCMSPKAPPVLKSHKSDSQDRGPLRFSGNIKDLEWA